MYAQEANELERLIVDNSDLEHLEDLIAEFNIFEVLGVQTRETRHSAFLAWLLDPSGNHGLGDYFLRRFLWQVTSRARAVGMTTTTAFDVDGWKLTDVEVVTERHNIDILLTGDIDGFVCAVENKLFSGEHSDQLRRYRETVSREYPTLTPIFVLLSVEGDPAAGEEDASNYVPIGYTQIAELIQKSLESRGSNLGTDVRSALGQYVATLRRHVLSDSEIQRLARKIYQNHKGAIDLIIEARPDTLQAVREVVDSAVGDNRLIELDSSSKSYIRFFDPRWDDILQLREGEGWTPSNRMLLFEITNNLESMGINLLIGPGPENTRRKIFDVAVESPKVFSPARKTMPRNWATIYRKRVLSKQDYQNADLDAIRVKVEKALTDLTVNDLDHIYQLVEVALSGD